MKQNIFMVLVISLALGFLQGCGSGGGDSVDPVQERCPAGTPWAIIDNDNFDNDWLSTLVGAMELDKRCEFDIKAIVITGTDVNAKSGILYSSVLKSYGRDIPIGINTRNQMRTAQNPLSNVPAKMDYRYTGTAESVLDYPSHELYDNEFVEGEQQDSVSVLCKVLEDAPIETQVNYVIGGHMFNMQDILAETELCNGLELVRTKVDRVPIFSAWSKNREGTCGMNFSEGYCGTHSAVQASTYMWNNMPNEVQVILFNVPGYYRSSKAMAYYIDNKVDTAEGFLSGVAHGYGAYEKMAIGDYPAVLYAGVGHDWYGTNFSTLVETCFRYTSEGRMYSGAPCGKNHWYVQTTLGEVEYLDFMDRTLLDLISQ